MSHFYASIPESARKTEATARGHKSTGITTRAASWAGAVVVRMWHDEAAEVDRYEVKQDTHHGEGVSQLLCSGTVGERVGTSGQIAHMVQSLEGMIDGQDPATDEVAEILSPIADLLVSVEAIRVKAQAALMAKGKKPLDLDVLTCLMDLVGLQHEDATVTESTEEPATDTQAEQVKWTALMGGLMDALSEEGAATKLTDNPAVMDRYYAAVGILERLASDLDDLNYEIGGDYLAVYQAATACLETD